MADETNKKLMIEDANEFLANLQTMIDKSLQPIKNTLNELIVEKEYTIDEVAALLGRHHSTIRAWIKAERLEYVQYGKIFMITQSALEKFKTEHKRNHPTDSIFPKLDN